MGSSFAFLVIICVSWPHHLVISRNPGRPPSGSRGTSPCPLVISMKSGGSYSAFLILTLSTWTFHACHAEPSHIVSPSGNEMTLYCNYKKILELVLLSFLFSDLIRSAGVHFERIALRNGYLDLCECVNDSKHFNLSSY